MRRNVLNSIALVWATIIVSMALNSCLKNDIPYPHIQANFLTITAEGQSQGSNIDSVNRNVTLYFPEEVDIYNVKISEYTLTPDASIASGSITDGIDLSKPAFVTLRLYQDYLWTITGVQNIQRYFTLRGQIGTSVIDAPGRRVVATISDTENINAVLVESVKLGASGSTMTPDITGQRVDFSKPVTIEISNFGRKETWTIYVSVTQSSVTTSRVDAWTSVAWVYAQAQAGKDNGIEYRLKGDEQWTKVPSSWITAEGGSFYARLIHLDPLTTYETRAYSDTEYGAVIEFTTGSVVQVPNTTLDSWWLDGKIWNPWPENGEQYWDTGNKGATTLGPSNSVPTDDTSTGQGWAAKLETKFVGIGPLGKLAAGNLFVGRYVKTDGTNGILSFGRPFVERPTKLTGYMKYTTAPISSVTQGFENLSGRPDTCIVWCALIDTAEPFEIRTNPKNRQLFDPDGSYVVAYGKIQYGETIGSYIPFEFELEYKNTNRKPTYILITASASKYGDYFTGGNGAILYVDDLKLEYDY